MSDDDTSVHHHYHSVIPVGSGCLLGLGGLILCCAGAFAIVMQAL